MNVCLKRLIQVLIFLGAVLFLFDSRNLGFLFVLGLASLVVMAAKFNTTLVKASHVFALIFAPQLVVLMVVLFDRGWGLLGAMARLYEYGFENLLVGVSKMTRRLASDGYAERARDVKALVLIGFLAASMSAYPYLVAMATVGDSYKQVNRVVRADDSWFRRNLGALVVFLGFLAGAIFLDIYNPDCTSRCSNIQSSNFPGVFVLTAFYSIVFIIAGLWVNYSLIRKALLKAQQGE